MAKKSGQSPLERIFESVLFQGSLVASIRMSIGEVDPASTSSAPLGDGKR